jgi:hypothetical protein
MYHGAALMSDGSVVAWGGDNSWGQIDVPAVLAQGSNATQGQAMALPSVTATQIACGRNFTLALLSNGSIIGW